MTIIYAFLIYLAFLNLMVKLILWVYTGVHFGFVDGMNRASLSYMLAVLVERLRAAWR